MTETSKLAYANIISQNLDDRIKGSENVEDSQFAVSKASTEGIGIVRN